MKNLREMLRDEDFEGIDRDSRDTNNSTTWYVNHGNGQDDVLISDDGNEWKMNEAGAEIRPDGGVHGLNTADGSDTYIELDAHTSGTNSVISTTVNIGDNDSFNLTFNFITNRDYIQFILVNNFNVVIIFNYNFFLFIDIVD